MPAGECSLGYPFPIGSWSPSVCLTGPRYSAVLLHLWLCWMRSCSLQGEISWFLKSPVMFPQWVCTLCFQVGSALWDCWGNKRQIFYWNKNNKSEQISRIIVGSGKNNILFNFIFLQDCLRDDALVPPTPPGYVKDKKEQRVQNCSEKSGVFMDPPLPFPIIQERTLFSPTSPTRKQTGWASFSWPQLHGSEQELWILMCVLCSRWSSKSCFPSLLQFPPLKQWKS